MSAPPMRSSSKANDRSTVGLGDRGAARDGSTKQKEGAILKKLIRAIGTLMVLVGLGLVALFLIGPPGGTAGSVPTGIETQNSEAPADGTLYLTIPKIGLEDVTVYDSLSEERLDESAIHLPETGFPWQPGANTYIAGHRMGFFGTDSFLVFFRLNELSRGDEIILEDAAGVRYVYRVTESLVVGPEDTSVLEPVPVTSIVSLQTCTLPDYSDRLVVRGELVA
jgi:sortase A